MSVARSLLCTLSALGILSATLLAQEAPPPQVPTENPVHVPVRFSNLRFEEDWSDLAEENATTNHRWPEPKWIALGDGWGLSFGGQIRLRNSHEKDKALGAPGPRTNDYYLLRTRIHADLRNANGWRFFVEGLDARVHGNDRNPAPIDRNNLDLQNGFAEYERNGWMGRVGRMEMQYGAQRLVSPLEWGNTRRRFQGALGRVAGSSYRTDVFAVNPMIVNPRTNDNAKNSQLFTGVYNTFDITEDASADLFYLQLHDDHDSYTSENGSTGDMRLHTFGARLNGDLGPADYDLWTAWQTGDFANDTIDAFAWSVSTGYTFEQTDGKPRVGLDVDYASGDGNPNDGDHETFNQLYPLGHAYFGFMDLVGRQNIIDVSPNASVKVAENATFRVAWHMFRLAERKDGLYNAGGGRSFHDPTGGASRDVGDEIDITLSMRPQFMSPHSQILLGYSHFESGDHITDLGGRNNADQVYMQVTMTF